MTPTNEMQAFAAVAALGSFAAASNQMGITPSATSKLVSRLENRLGLRLLHRTTRKVTLTAEGEVYHTRVRDILDDIAAAESDLLQVKGAPRGPLRISTGIAFAMLELAPVLSEFTQNYPEIELSIAATDRVTDPVTERADLVIRTGPHQDSEFAMIPLRPYVRSVCVAQSYIDRHGCPETLADLKAHTCIVYTPPVPVNWQQDPALPESWAKGAKLVAVDSPDLKSRMLLHGVGIARVTDALLTEALEDGRVVRILSDAVQFDPLEVQVLYRPGRHVLPKIRVFLEFLETHFGTGSRARSEPLA